MIVNAAVIPERLYLFVVLVRAVTIAGSNELRTPSKTLESTSEWVTPLLELPLAFGSLCQSKLPQLRSFGQLEWWVQCDHENHANDICDVDMARGQLEQTNTL